MVSHEPTEPTEVPIDPAANRGRPTRRAIVGVSRPPFGVIVGVGITVMIALLVVALLAGRKRTPAAPPTAGVAKQRPEEDGQDVRYSDAAAQAAADQRREKIRAEVKALGGDHWAGEYYCGDGLGMNAIVAIAPKSGFVFEWHGCLGLYDRNYGPVTYTDGRIRLSFVLDRDESRPPKIAEELVPISWGDRRYLVPADDIAGFCNEVNDGSEPRHGPRGKYLLRRGDGKREAAGLPDVPGEYRAYLLRDPIEATITAVGLPTTRPSIADWDFKLTPVTVSEGTNAGLLAGMKLYVIEPGDVAVSVEITKAEGDRSEGVITRISDREPAPQIGWRLSTRPRWAGAVDLMNVQESPPAGPSQEDF